MDMARGFFLCTVNRHETQYIGQNIWYRPLDQGAI